MNGKFFSMAIVLLIVIGSFGAVGSIFDKTQTIDDPEPNPLSGGDIPTARFTWKAYGWSPFFAIVLLDASGSSNVDVFRWETDTGSSTNWVSSPRKFYIFPDGNRHVITLQVKKDARTDVAQHLVFARPIYRGATGSYSVSYITKYNHWTLDDLSLYSAEAQSKEFQYVLKAAGWNKRFVEIEGNVKESTFTSDLAGSNFHYHFGHGIYDWTGDFVTELALKNWDIFPDNGDVRPQDVKNKWNNKCKWVWLHSCHILEDDNSGMPGHYKDYFRDKWAGALNTCHIIMGFASLTYPSSTLITEFFDAALGIGDRIIPKGLPIVEAYKIATKFEYGSNVKGAVIADTYDQFTDDHLYGQGTVHSDEDPNDNYYRVSTWSC